ncbi:MAG: anti-sigma factor family protein [Bradymonadaceae bacterium]
MTKHRCQKVIDLLVDYLEGELPKDEREHLEAHFADCPPCLNFLETYKETGHICRCAIEKALPEPMKEALLDHLRTKIQPAQKKSS